MMFLHIICAALAPAVAHAAAFPWSLPEPTHLVPAVDVWSPAPTQAPQIPVFELFRRQQLEGDNTCGFVSGSSESSITCFATNAICATNTYNGVHGCCDPSAMSKCTIPTTCIASTAMSTACTDAACSSNAAIAKCTGDGLGECYKWLFVYSKTTMTEHGCASSKFTSTAQRSWGVSTSTPPAKTVTVTAPPATTHTTSTDSSESSKPSNIGVIVGGTIGGCVFLSIIAFIIFLVYRRRKAQRDSIVQPPRPGTHYHNPSITEYNPLGFPTTGTYVENDHKVWQQQGAVHRSSNAVPQYPGMNQYGVVEVDGRQRPAEAPG